jgi:ribosomal protein L35
MESTARLFQCVLCHAQVIICSKCDHGQIYCNGNCSSLARQKSLKAAGKRYQATNNGKRNHAARQARYEMKLKSNLTHHSSIEPSSCDSMEKLENETNKLEKGHLKPAFICCFCHKLVSIWLRNNFLQQIRIH